LDLSSLSVREGEGDLAVDSNPTLPEIERVLTLEAEAILDCVGRLKIPERAQALEKSVALLKDTLDSGGKIVLTGVGKSGKVAQKIAATLCSTGSQAVYLHPTEGLHGDLGLVQPQDVVFCLSYTGNTEELIQLVPLLKSRGIAIVGLGGNKQSQLAHSSDAWIDAEVASEACPHGLAPTTSTTLALALGDAIAVALMSLRGFDEKSFARNHPGGGLGKRLHLRVKDLMQSGPLLALANPEDTMEKVVLASTQKKLGAVLIVSENRLLGLITDGDIRRALQFKEKFFQMKAEEVMTREPVTADPEMMAHSALALMENRPNQIQVLPVIEKGEKGEKGDEEGRCLGLLRLHDLWSTF
jgi:arabinose-5-phosphate isomerase